MEFFQFFSIAAGLTYGVHHRFRGGPRYTSGVVKGLGRLQAKAIQWTEEAGLGDSLKCKTSIFYRLTRSREENEGFRLLISCVGSVWRPFWTEETILGVICWC